MTDQQVEVKLPPAVEGSGKSEGPPVLITREEMPWLRAGEKREIPLAQVKLMDGTVFLLGNAVRGRFQEITEESFGRDEKGNQTANNLLYARISDFLHDRSNHLVHTIQRPVSGRKIHYVGNKDGVRVYFMRFDDRGELPVIIRIGACANKNQEFKVLKVISTDRTPRV